MELILIWLGLAVWLGAKSDAEFRNRFLRGSGQTNRKGDDK